eukprot:SAG11_NODE_1919_length_4070_cov_2.351801_2_plen_187_part_00
MSADEGAGIYRHVYLIGTGATHIEQDGVFAPATVTSEIVRAKTQAAVGDNSGGLSADASVHASATVVGPDSVTVKFTLYDGDTAVAHGSSAAAGAGAHNASLSVSGAKLWSIGSPHLYTLVSEVQSGGNVSDSVNTSIGIRSIRYSGDGGFFVSHEVTIRVPANPLAQAFWVPADERGAREGARVL